MQHTGMLRVLVRRHDARHLPAGDPADLATDARSRQAHPAPTAGLMTREDWSVLVVAAILVLTIVVLIGF